MDIDLTAAEIGPQVVHAYLSNQHFENIEDSCPMIALPCDVARGGHKAKRAFETVFRAMVRFLERDLKNRNHPRVTAAQAIGALCVGGMVIARAIDDRALADEVRKASLTVALALGGWGEHATKKPPVVRVRKAQSF